MQFNNPYAFRSCSLGSFQHIDKLLWPGLLILPLREKAHSLFLSLFLCFCVPRPSNEHHPPQRQPPSMMFVRAAAGGQVARRAASRYNAREVLSLSSISMLTSSEVPAASLYTLTSRLSC